MGKVFKQTASMQTRDGVRLDADIYRPDEAGEFPVLLMRQPYGRSIASTVVYAHPSWYAAQGYIVVIQDVRGRGSSEGEFDLFAHEVEDGYDAIAWAAVLPGSTGQVGMYGFSYQGMTQLYAAAHQPPALKTICPAMIAYDLHSDWAYEGGAFCYQLNLAWAIQLEAETLRRQQAEEDYRTLYAAARNLPLHDPVCAQSDLLKQFGANSFYHDWLNHPDRTDSYWRRSPCYHVDAVDLPMLHIGGWFDTHLRGTIAFYKAMRDRSAHPQHLWIGPWAHLPWGRKAGAIDYGAEAASPIDRLQIRWFDQFLKGIDTGLREESPVCLFEMGSNVWRSFDSYPSSSPQHWSLTSTGLAAMDDREGRLLPPDGPLAEAAADTLVHDPWRPVPSLGGHATFPAGSFDRAALDCRTDILTYTSAPLEANLHLAGDITVTIACTADNPSFDLCAVLSEVRSNGIFNFAQGYQRVDEPTDGAIAITLQPTCIQLAKGNALRLSLSAANFPAYAVNAGDGSQPCSANLIHARVITLHVHSGKAEEPLSFVALPVRMFNKTLQ